ncbi:hypothetical protein DL765_011437 [Monosporascus sp. GIB2]|nr:hypothetical protein DL765_011437 [Monosporascus sp. GIB2]
MSERRGPILHRSMNFLSPHPKSSAPYRIACSGSLSAAEHHDFAAPVVAFLFSLFSTVGGTIVHAPVVAAGASAIATCAVSALAGVGVAPALAVADPTAPLALDPAAPVLRPWLWTITTSYHYKPLLSTVGHFAIKRSLSRGYSHRSCKDSLHNSAISSEVFDDLSSHHIPPPITHTFVAEGEGLRHPKPFGRGDRPLSGPDCTQEFSSDGTLASVEEQRLVNPEVKAAKGWTPKKKTTEAAGDGDGDTGIVRVGMSGVESEPELPSGDEEPAGEELLVACLRQSR